MPVWWYLQGSVLGQEVQVTCVNTHRPHVPAAVLALGEHRWDKGLLATGEGKAMTGHGVCRRQL